MVAIKLIDDGFAFEPHDIVVGTDGLTMCGRGRCCVCLAHFLVGRFKCFPRCWPFTESTRRWLSIALRLVTASLWRPMQRHVRLIDVARYCGRYQNNVVVIAVLKLSNGTAPTILIG